LKHRAVLSRCKYTYTLTNNLLEGDEISNDKDMHLPNLLM